MLLFDPREIEFLDTRHVSGLKGTGSNDYQVTDLFVPEDRAVGYLITENPDRPLDANPPSASPTTCFA